MMEKITLQNYEAFLLDLMEGQLVPDQEKMLMQFLKEHPGLVPELPDTVPAVSPDAERNAFMSKEKLLKSIPRFSKVNEETADAAMIAWWEGDLSAGEKIALQQYISTSEKEKLKFERYGTLFLVPDQNQVYPHKKRLTKRETPVFSLTSALIFSAAAVILILLLTVPFKQFFIPESPDNGSIEKLTSQQTERLDPVGTDHAEKATTPEARFSETTEKRQLALLQPREKQPQKTTREVPDVHKEQIQREPDIDYLASASVPGLHVIQDLSLRNMQTDIPVTNNDRYLSVGQWLSYKIKSGLLKDNDVRPGDPITAGDFLDAGIKGVNAVTGWNIQAEQTRDTLSGRVTFLAVTSQLLGYTRSREK